MALVCIIIDACMHTNSTSTHLVVHGIKAMCCDDISCMDKTVKCTCTLSEMRIIRIIRPNSIKNQIQTIGEIGNAGPETVQIETIFNVGSFYLTKHFMALETAEPVYKVHVGTKDYVRSDEK
jgi:hypothetical protein